MSIMKMHNEVLEKAKKGEDTTELRAKIDEQVVIDTYRKKASKQKTMSRDKKIATHKMWVDVANSMMAKLGGDKSYEGKLDIGKQKMQSLLFTWLYNWFISNGSITTDRE